MESAVMAAITRRHSNMRMTNLFFCRSMFFFLLCTHRIFSPPNKKGYSKPGSGTQKECVATLFPVWPSIRNGSYPPPPAIYPRCKSGKPNRILDLAPDEVCLCRICCQLRGRLLPCLFTLTLLGRLFSEALSVSLSALQ